MLREFAPRYERLVRDFSMVRQIDEAKALTEDQDALCLSLVRTVAGTLPAGNCSILLLDQAADRLVLAAAASPLEAPEHYFSPAHPLSFGRNEGVAGRAFETGKTVYVPDVTRAPDYMVRLPNTLETGALIATPIPGGDQTLGVLNASHQQPGTFPPEVRHALEVAAERIGRVLMTHQMHNRLRTSEIEHRLLMENARDGILLFGPNGQVLQANRSVTHITGHPPHAFTSGHVRWEAGVHPDDREAYGRFQRETNRAGAYGSHLYRYIDAQGETHYLEQVNSPMWTDARRYLGIAADIRDLTPQREAQDRLIASEERYRSFVENTPEIIVRVDREGKYIFANRAFLETIGKRLEDVVGRGPEVVEEFTHPEDYPQVKADGFAVLETGERRLSEVRYRHKDGSWRWMQHLAFPWYTPDGEIGGAEAVGRDITEQKRVEDVLRRRDAVLEAVSYMAQRFLQAERWESVAVDALKRLTLKTGMRRIALFEVACGTDTSARLNHRFEWRAPENTAVINNRGYRDFGLAGLGLQCWEEKLRAGEAVAGCTTDFPEAEQQLFAYEQTGCLALVPIFQRGQWWGVLEFDAGAPRQWHAAEIEAFRMAASIIGGMIERQAADKTIAEQQARMVNSSRLSSIGMLASGVAHEINNPLAIIQVGIEQIERMAQERAVNPELLGRTTERITRNISRIERIIRSLRNLSRDGSSEARAYHDLAAIAGEALELCRARFENQGIRLDFHQPPQPAVVECQPTLLGQVLMNLLNNAFDAVESAPEKWVRLEMAELEDGVEISVLDGGPGVPVEARERMLEPFFTTKPLGKGTGLGLSISKAIIDNHHGKLYLDGTCAETRFVIWLPRTPSKGAN